MAHFLGHHHISTMGESRLQTVDVITAAAGFCSDLPGQASSSLVHTGRFRAAVERGAVSLTDTHTYLPAYIHYL